MKQFINAYPESTHSIAYTGYRNLININQIMIIYKTDTENGLEYNIIVNFRSSTETWKVNKETYNELLNLELLKSS